MKKYLLSASIVALVVSAGCTTLTAPEETKQLKYAASVFTNALSDAQTAQRDARAANQLETLRSIAARGGEIRIVTSCAEAVGQWRIAFDGAVANPADWRAMDAVYARRVSLAACDLPNHDIRPQAGSIAASLADPEHALALRAANLSEAAAHLNAYVDALADIAGGESSAAVDAARGKVAVAARGLASVLSPDNAVVGPVIDLVNQAIGWITASRRNAATRNFLNEMDRAMPDLMERLGLAGRLRVSEALLNRAEAAESAAQVGASALNANRRRRAAANAVDLERLRVFDDVASRLELHNLPFRQLRASDPMIAARAFARAHRKLRDVFNDPDANREGFQTAFNEFLTSATALAEALRKANEE